MIWEVQGRAGELVDGDGPSLTWILAEQVQGSAVAAGHGCGVQQLQCTAAQHDTIRSS